MNIMSHININKIIRIDINKETDIHNFCIYLKNPIASNIITASKFRIKKALAFRRLHLINYNWGFVFGPHWRRENKWLRSPCYQNSNVILFSCLLIHPDIGQYIIIMIINNDDNNNYNNNNNNTNNNNNNKNDNK